MAVQIGSRLLVVSTRGLAAFPADVFVAAHVCTDGTRAVTCWFLPSNPLPAAETPFGTTRNSIYNYWFSARGIESAAVVQHNDLHNPLKPHTVHSEQVENRVPAVFRTETHATPRL
jgi:hypothetical protein